MFDLYAKIVVWCSYFNSAYFRNRQEGFMSCPDKDGDLLFCDNAQSLLQELGFPRKAWGMAPIFDSSKISLKTVFIHNYPEYTSVNVTHATSTKILYKYEIIGLQVGFIKFWCFFLWKWDCRAINNNTNVLENWPQIISITSRVKNVFQEP